MNYKIVFNLEPNLVVVFYGFELLVKKYKNEQQNII